MITFQLESRFTKPQIFAMYANEMNLVHRGSYEINGVAEASQTLFGKDLRQLDLAQVATIAALFQNPIVPLVIHHDHAIEKAQKEARRCVCRIRSSGQAQKASGRPR